MDSIALLSVRQPDAAELARGHSTHFVVQLQYTLNSYDAASLSLNLDEFSDPASCVPKAGEIFKTVAVGLGDAGRIAISRGTHIVEIPVTWPDDLAKGDVGRPLESGTISFESSMWLDPPNYRFLTRSFGTQFCQRFGN